MKAVAPTASVAVRTLNMVLLVVAETRILGGEEGKEKGWGDARLAMHAGQEVLEALFEPTRLARSHSGRLRRPLYVHKERGMPSDTRALLSEGKILNRQQG